MAISGCSQISKPKGKLDLEIAIPIAVAFAFLLLAAMLFDSEGFRTVGLWLLLYIVPVYIILNKMGLDSAESFIFAVFVTRGTIPALIFFLNFVVPSLRISAIIIFVVEAAAAVYVASKPMQEIRTMQENKE